MSYTPNFYCYDATTAYLEFFDDSTTTYIRTYLDMDVALHLMTCELEITLGYCYNHATNERTATDVRIATPTQAEKTRSLYRYIALQYITAETEPDTSIPRYNATERYALKEDYNSYYYRLVNPQAPFDLRRTNIIHAAKVAASSTRTDALLIYRTTEPTAKDKLLFVEVTSDLKSPAKPLLERHKDGYLLTIDKTTLLLSQSHYDALKRQLE